MAQEVERVLGKDEVTGSNPVSSSKQKPRFMRGFFCYNSISIVCVDRVNNICKHVLITRGITFVKFGLLILLLFVNNKKWTKIIKLPCSLIKAALFFQVLILTIFVVPIIKLR